MAELYNKRKDILCKHMDKLTMDNEAYFKLVRGNDNLDWLGLWFEWFWCLWFLGGLVCGYCLRPRDLALDYKKGAESLYQRDYKPHDGYKGVPRVGSAFFKS